MAVTDMKTQKLDQKLKQLHRYKEGERGYVQERTIVLSTSQSTKVLSLLLLSQVSSGKEGRHE